MQVYLYLESPMFTVLHFQWSIIKSRIWEKQIAYGTLYSCLYVVVVYVVKDHIYKISKWWFIRGGRVGKKRRAKTHPRSSEKVKTSKGLLEGESKNENIHPRTLGHSLVWDDHLFVRVVFWAPYLDSVSFLSRPVIKVFLSIAIQCEGGKDSIGSAIGSHKRYQNLGQRTFLDINIR